MLLRSLFAISDYCADECDLDTVKLQDALDKISEWANDWQLTVSVENVVYLK